MKKKAKVKKIGKVNALLYGILYSISAVLIDIIQKMCSKQAFSKGKESERGNIAFNEGYKGEGASQVA